MIGITEQGNAARSPGYKFRNNRFVSNQCEQRGVINIRGDSKLLEVSENYFYRNRGIDIFIEESVTYAPSRIVSNVFEGNLVPSGGVVEIRRTERDIVISNNTFLANKAQNVIFLQVVQNVNSNMVKQVLQITNNTLQLNKPFMDGALELDCTVSLYGSVANKLFEFYYNKLNNKEFEAEACFKFTVTSHQSKVNISKNWWGTEKESTVRDRIVDFDDYYDYPVAKYAPFVLKEHDVYALSGNKENAPLPTKILSGRLFKSSTLTVEDSPYLVKGDLTVLPNVTLTIEAGVEVRVSERRSILVLGTLIANGTKERKVYFKSVDSFPLASKIPLRLTDGRFPWYGRLEAFHNKTWMPVCKEAWQNLDAKVTAVVCKQLGYKASIDGRRLNPAAVPLLQVNSNLSWPFHVSCYGNESTIDECQLTPSSKQCSRQVSLRCVEKTWGGIRFSSKPENVPYEKKSVLEHVDLLHCGQRQNTEVAGIETVFSVPRMKHVSVKNCTSGGLTIFAPPAILAVSESTFSNTGKIGVSVVQSQKRIILDRVVALHNEHGIVFASPNFQNIPSFISDRIELCASFNNEIKLEAKALLFYDIPSLRPTSNSGNVDCRRKLNASHGHGVKLTLLYYKGNQRIQVYFDDLNSPKVNKWSNHYGYHDELKLMLGKPLYIPRQAVEAHWFGDVHSKIMLQAESYTLNGKLTY